MQRNHSSILKAIFLLLLVFSVAQAHDQREVDSNSGASRCRKRRCAAVEFERSNQTRARKQQRHPHVAALTTRSCFPKRTSSTSGVNVGVALRGHPSLLHPQTRPRAKLKRRYDSVVPAGWRKRIDRHERRIERIASFFVSTGGFQDLATSHQPRLFAFGLRGYEIQPRQCSIVIFASQLDVDCR